MKIRNKIWPVLWTLSYIVSLLICVVSYTLTYLTENVQVASFNQLLYTLQVSMGGAESVVQTILLGFAQSYSLWILLLTLIYFAGLQWMQYRLMVSQTVPEYYEQKTRLQKGALIGALCTCLLCVSFLGGQLAKGYSILGIQEYLESRSRYSTLYENYYVKPNETAVTFPEKKKNLIYIFLESMETTYASLQVEEESAEKENVIPYLSQMAKEGETFGTGAQVTSSTSWTVAGMVAETSGTPLCLSNDTFNHNFEKSARFMPKLKALGEVLEENGYSNHIMMGSKSEYAGRANYFKQHGNYDIFDLQTARDRGLVGESYYEWWGFEDSRLFTYAKDELSRIAEAGEPFNFTMLTADTHFSDGYECPDCPDTYDVQMKNVIACSDHRMHDFISWIQQQPWYEDTVIVIAGDHLSMDYSIANHCENPDERRVFFTVLNGPEYQGEDRQYTTLDIFPTTIEALGADIEGDRLGLGTSLYGDAPTLTELLGFDDLNEQISSKSNYYNSEILDTENHEQDLQVKTS